MVKINLPKTRKCDICNRRRPYAKCEFGICDDCMDHLRAENATIPAPEMTPQMWNGIVRSVPTIQEKQQDEQ